MKESAASHMNGFEKIDAIPSSRNNGGGVSGAGVLS